MYMLYIYSLYVRSLGQDWCMGSIKTSERLYSSPVSEKFVSHISVTSFASVLSEQDYEEFSRRDGSKNTSQHDVTLVFKS